MAGLVLVDYRVLSGQVKARVVLTCTNGVSPSHLPVIVASDHVVDTCPLTKSEGGLNLLHEADDDAVIRMESTATAALAKLITVEFFLAKWSARPGAERWLSGFHAPAVSGKEPLRWFIVVDTCSCVRAERDVIVTSRRRAALLACRRQLPRDVLADHLDIPRAVRGIQGGSIK